MDIANNDENNYIKLYRGAYNYYRNSTIYSEENFEVLKDKKEHSITFASQLHSRVATGELLNIKVNYTVNKDYIPIHVAVTKLLGEDSTEEIFEYEARKNQLLYTFIDKNQDITERELTTSPRFHIATPASSSSILFIRSKKFDTTGKNVYQSWKSTNSWVFESDPEIKNFALEKVSQGFESLIIGGQTLQSTEYKLHEHTFDEASPNKAKEDPPYIRVYLSKHMAIPYLIRDFEGTKIEVKYLNDLD